MKEQKITEEVEINYLKQEQEIEQEILLAQLSEAQVISENKRIKRLLDKAEKNSQTSVKQLSKENIEKYS